MADIRVFGNATSSFRLKDDRMSNAALAERLGLECRAPEDAGFEDPCFYLKDDGGIAAIRMCVDVLCVFTHCTEVLKAVEELRAS